ncbi:toll-like receptor 8 isoform X2 [Electrophorus electricus]|uniref:toll-like receptor 8 isoform X2 n=1 Tax=Electrophorus electricus TaxID=8005 RepID=UPI0015CFBA04|nr:toll-like receptor 8 isoform X2 [Electrophorus electricus]
MNSSTYWLRISCWLMVAFLISPASCKLNEKLLRTHPCDVHENTTVQKVVFNCHGRGLREVPLVFKNATSLDLSENKIRNLKTDSLKDLQKLTDLNLNWLNQHHEVNITPGVFANLTNLQRLQLNGVGLRSIPDQLPNSLKQLRLIENKILSLSTSSFSQVTKLTHLYLSRNCYYWNSCLKVFKIENGSLLVFTNLTSLTLSYNNLSHVPRHLPVSIRTLDLASNSIAHIGEDDFKELHDLIILKLQGNCPRCHNAPYPCTPCPNRSIEIHDRAFDSLKHLELLHLAGNSIYYMRSYPDTVRLAPSFANLTSLRTLHIQGLVFKEIDNCTLAPLYKLQNLSVLNLGVNFIVRAKSNVFRKFSYLKLLYLSENRLYPLTTSEVRNPGNTVKSPSSLPRLSGSGTQREQSFEVSKMLVKRECYTAGRVLDLSRNNLFFISPEQFEGYKNISCLNLSRNGFAAAPNGSEFTSLPHLKYLDLSFNKIDLAYYNAFKELQKLEVLDLSFNPHYFTVSGVTHNLDFLKNLPNLRVLNMSSNSIFTLTTKQMHSDSLNELQFQHNNLGMLWREKDRSYDKLFQYLTNLTYLDISYNHIGKIPNRVYNYLPVKIKTLRLTHNDLVNFNWTLIRNLKQLEELILSHNYLLYISNNLSDSAPSLRYLDLSHNKISWLSSGFLNCTVNLHWLDLSYNRLESINQSTFSSKQENHLRNLCLHKNPFRCTCDILDFILWIRDSDVKIPRLATSVKCNTPQQVRGIGVIFFDIKECIDAEVAFLAYFFSTSFIFCVTFVATVMHMFYWDASYVFYYLKAKLKGYQQLSSAESVYDAFITYDTKDPLVSDWVLNQLRVQLEERGERLLPVCLEERDWVPGCPVLESMAQSIQQSRKTVFVLTRAYVTSGAFKMAVYLAHQRLLDESEDVIVLLLLEPSLPRSHFLRLRKRLCGHSVLEWPHTPAAEPWFWQNLRNAIHMENRVMYNKIYSRYFTTRKKVEVD